MQTYSIYKAINKLTGKSYIGIEQNWPRRFSSHKHAAKSKSEYYSHRAIRKYGFENFAWEILYQTEERDLAADAEVFYIKIFNSFGKHGYNRTKEKIAEKNRFRIPSEEERKKNSNSIKLKWKDPIWREKMMISRRTKHNVSSI